MRSFSILVVDDQPAVLAALENAIRAFFPSARILLSSNADEAWNLVHQYRPDIVLSDIAMPTGISGLELCTRIKANPDLRTTYVILMTAFSHAEWQGQAIQHRADAFLRKPFRLPELQEKLEAALRAIELFQARHVQTPESPAAGDDLLSLLTSILRLRSPSLVELVNPLMQTCRWLSEHTEELPEEERPLLPLAGFVYVLGRLALPDQLLQEPLTRSGYLSHELMIQVLLGAATLCHQHPRLAPAAPIVGAICENYDGSGVPEGRRAWEIPLAARLLRLAVDFEEMLWSSPQSAVVVAAHMERFARQAYDVQLIPLILQYANLRETAHDMLATGLHELRPGMMLAHDIQTRSGLKLATAGTVVTERLLERLLRYHAHDPIVGIILIHRSSETR
ncbi:MAG: response regulator [Candidatus Kapabacteria bacterium]|nr:response regulator [Candidatus Kapabacteria bacterium]MCS7169840.1 response regulator [Candidatus Kapabacteria bacterium]MDW7996967.1 response regulator [Bacteroidota bacterium]MDW8225236.1 response regulator [Bacteroidota bacterium]